MSDTKDLILRTALHLFAQDGFEAVSISQIAGALGMSKGALYKHYKNKRDLFNSIVQKMERDDAERSQAYSMPGEDLETYSRTSLAQLNAFALAQFTYWTEDPFASDFRRMLIVEQYRDAEMQYLFQQILSEGQLSYVEMLFTSWGVPSAAERAMAYFAPLHLCYSLYDGCKDRAGLLHKLQQHFDHFSLEG